MLNLIPAPRGSVHMQEGSVKLPETVTVSLGDFAPWCLEAFAARLDGHVDNCSASRDGIEGKTNEDSKEVQTEKLSLKAVPLANGMVKAYHPPVVR